MRRKSIFSVLVFVGVVAFVGISGLVWAQPPDIHIDLNFDNPSYNYGEPVGVEVVVTNESGNDILISKGFSSMVYYLEMRVIDPSGRLLLVRHEEFHDEFPDAPPLAYVLYQGRPIRVASCEVLPTGWQETSRTEDLGEHYDLGLPGHYSAQVQLSAMVFKGASGDPCDVNDYEWLGVLDSETKYFYLEGTTEVKVFPKRWRLAWRRGRYIFPNVKVSIWPQDGIAVKNYDKESIRLNNVEAKKVWKLYSFKKKQHYLLAFFSKKEAINSLGDVERGQWYPVVISGRLTSGQFFGGGQKVKIVR